jgi:hypothetical protein
MIDAKTWGAALALGLALGSSAAAEPEQVQTNPELFYLDHHDVSPPLRDIAPIAPSERVREGSPLNRRRPDWIKEAPAGWVDPLERLSRPDAPQPEVGTTAGLNFEGVTSGAFPPDTNGAVGATQFVQWVNFSFAVYNKTTGALQYGPAAGSTLWSGFGGPCQNNNSGDPIVAYDKRAARWVMTQFAFPSASAGPWYQCVAVSTSSDATGTWRRFAYNFAALNDYPKVGVWSDGYYITFNMFAWNGSSFSYQGGRTCALDRNNMITASNTPGAIQCFQNAAWYSIVPADLDGTTAPPAGAPNYQVSLGASNSLYLYKFKVNWTTPSLSTFSGPTSVTVASYGVPAFTAVPQPGTTQLLDTLGDRLMNRLAYRNFGTHEALTATHTVSTASGTGMRWYEIRNPNGTPAVQQQGTFAPDSTYRFMGSIAQDKSGNMLLGYNAASSSVYPGIRYTGRLASDALNTMQAENTLIAGARSQTNSNRYGDYSAMTVDPVDDCTFWFTGEYLKTGTTIGSTRIGSFKFPSCGGGGTCGSYTFTCDDGDTCFSLFGPSQYWHRETLCGGTSVGMFGDLYWTYVNGSVVSNYARWRPTLPCAANYTVQVFVPRCYGTSLQARYRVFHNGVSDYVTVNQNAIFDQWVTLGTFFFANNGTEFVELTDATGEAASTLRQLSFDAVRWSK